MADVLSPLEQLYAFPTMMKWRGTWVGTEQYFKNDVVISPINSSSYILVNETVSLIPTDPSLDPNWDELSPATVGVTSVNGGAGITVTNPTGPNVTVINDGVITVTEGTNIIIDRTDPPNLIINAIAPSLTTVSLARGTIPINFPVAPNDVGTIVFTPIIDNIFFTYFANGPPTPTGVFDVDLTSINLFLNGTEAVGPDDLVAIFLVDKTNVANPIAVNIGTIVINPTNNVYPFQVRPSTYVVDIVAARNAGIRTPSYFAFQNLTTTAILEINNWSSVSAIYYPEGLQ